MGYQIFSPLCNYAIPYEPCLESGSCHFHPHFLGERSVIGQALTIRGSAECSLTDAQKEEKSGVFVCLTASSLCHKGEINRS